MDASGRIAQQVALPLVATEDPTEAAKLAQARKILEGLQRGTMDRGLLAANANSDFTEPALQDFAKGLSPLGALQSFVQTGQRFRGGMTLRVYAARFSSRNLRVWTYEMSDGKQEQYQIAPE